MKSIVCHGPKDIRVEEQPQPTAGSGQVLINVGAGGICGSDLHYFNHGGFGDIRIKEPMILGHEIAGTVVEMGENVTGLSIGDKVAINPSRPCYDCEYCHEGMFNQCLDMRYYGSAMRFPHIQGAFREQLAVEARQCVKLADDIPTTHGACAEPLSVAIGAINKIDKLVGKRVLVTGTGPIGALVVAAAKINGAIEVVATDMVDGALDIAKQLGADKTINVGTNGDDLKAYEADKGYFDAVIEASGSEIALRSALNVLKPRGQLVILGLGGDVNLPLNQLVAKEIRMTGNFRFHKEFFWAVDLINQRRVNLDALLTNTFPADEAATAFETANDRTQAMKVLLTFQH
jgi:L-idonate 5-dehydrogenase